MKTILLISRTIMFLTLQLSVGQLFSQQQLGTYIHYPQHAEQVNQAYSLGSDNAKLYSIGRKQWLGVEGAPGTFMLGGHLKTKNERSAFGASLLFDKTGPERYTESNIFYGHSVRLTENDYLAATVGMGLRVYKLQHALLESGDPALQADIDEKIGTFGLSFLYYRPEHLYVGVSLPRLGGGKFEEVELFRENYSAVAAYLHEIDKGFHIKMNTWIAWVQHQNDDRWLGNFSATAYFNRSLAFGVNYGTNKDVGVTASLLLTKSLKFGYGYQFGVARTNISGMRNGSHELSVSYHFSRDGFLKLL